VTLGVFVRARWPTALFSKFTINFWVNKQAFICILAIGKEFAWVFRMKEFALIIFQAALWPMAATRVFVPFRTSYIRHLEFILPHEACRWCRLSFE
jgi:hypothetical protein